MALDSPAAVFEMRSQAIFRRVIVLEQQSLGFLFYGYCGGVDAGSAWPLALSQSFGRLLELVSSESLIEKLISVLFHFKLLKLDAGVKLRVKAIAYQKMTDSALYGEP